MLTTTLGPPPQLEPLDDASGRIVDLMNENGTALPSSTACRPTSPPPPLLCHCAAHQMSLGVQFGKGNVVGLGYIIESDHRTHAGVREACQGEIFDFQRLSPAI